MNKNKIETNSDKLYYFCLSFSGKMLDPPLVGQAGQASCCIGYPEKLVTINRISEAKKTAGVASDAVLISASYLGHATRKEMTN